MNIFRDTAKAVIKQPFTLILIGALMLVGALLNTILPVMPFLIGVINMTGGGVIESVVSLLQTIMNPSIIPILLITIAVITLIFSVVAGLLLPGYLLTVDNGLSTGGRKSGIFRENINGSFSKFFLLTVKTVLLTVVLTLFLMVATVPAIVVTRAAFSTNPNILLGAMFIDLITIGVLFMAISFFRIYVYMWYIAAAKGAPKPFKAGKAVADSLFWSMALKLLCFDLVFAVVIFLIYLSDSQLFRYFAGWIFTTAFFTTLGVYLVNSYRSCRRANR